MALSTLFSVHLILTLFANSVTSQSHMTMEKYYRISGKKIVGYFYMYQKMTDISWAKCCLECTNDPLCLTMNYWKTERACFFSPFAYFFGDASILSNMHDTDWDVYANDDWFLIFYAVPGLTTDIADSWYTGVNTTAIHIAGVNDAITLENTNGSYGRLHGIEIVWGSFSEFEVEYALYSSDVKVAYIIFNATCSSIDNWFSTDRILASSWSNLKDLSSSEVFAIDGTNEMRFQITENITSCTGSVGFTIITQSYPAGCEFENYSKFLYSTEDSYVPLEDNTHSLKEADMMTIRLRNGRPTSN